MVLNLIAFRWLVQTTKCMVKVDFQSVTIISNRNHWWIIQSWEQNNSWTMFGRISWKWSRRCASIRAFCRLTHIWFWSSWRTTSRCWSQFWWTTVQIRCCWLHHRRSRLSSGLGLRPMKTNVLCFRPRAPIGTSLHFFQCDWHRATNLVSSNWCVLWFNQQKSLDVLAALDFNLWI